MDKFESILSSSVNSAAQNVAVHETIIKMVTLSKQLLPIFLLIRLIVGYFQNHLDSRQLIKYAYTSVLTLIVTFLWLQYYVNIFQLLDTLTTCLMDQFNWAALADSDAASNLKNTDFSIWKWIKDIGSIIANGALECISGVLCFASTRFRHQALIFSLQVGPLAIAASLLPGNFSGIASYWMNMVISFLMWGFTIDLIDYSLVTLDLQNGIGAAISTCLLYLMVGPLTSLYIGNTIGNSLFALGVSNTHQLISYGTRFLPLPNK